MHVMICEAWPCKPFMRSVSAITYPIIQKLNLSYYKKESLLSTTYPYTDILVT